MFLKLSTAISVAEWVDFDVEWSICNLTEGRPE